MKVDSRPCEVAGRQALCLDAETEAADQNVVARWQAVVVPLGSGSVMAAVIDQKQRFDEQLATEFLDSLEPLED